MRKETKICKDCGGEYQASIISDKQGDLPYGLICRDCQEKRYKQQYIEQRQEEFVKHTRESRQSQLELLPEYFRDKTFANFNPSLQPKAFDCLSKYDWRNKSAKSIVLLSAGIYGVGKTHLVCALAHKMIEENEPVTMDKEYRFYFPMTPFLFTIENKLMSRIRDTFNRKPDLDNWEERAETEENIYRLLERVPVLIIDDVGKVRPRDPSFLQSVYFRIIDSRYNEAKPIIITTNLDYAELEQHIGGASADRLREMAGSNFIKMSGKSQRIKGN